MTSSNDSQPRTAADKRRNSARKGFVWLMLAAIAAFPFPWWW